MFFPIKCDITVLGAKSVNINILKVNIWPVIYLPNDTSIKSTLSRSSDVIWFLTDS